MKRKNTNSYVSNWAKTNNIKTKLLGDINEDGSITASDARKILLYYVGQITSFD